MVGLDFLSDEIARKHLESPHEVKRIIKAFLEEIVKEVRAGNMVTIAGFGTFMAKTQRPRRFRDIKTRKIVHIPSRKKFIFHPSSKLKVRLRDEL